MGWGPARVGWGLVAVHIAVAIKRLRYLLGKNSTPGISRKDIILVSKNPTHDEIFFGGFTKTIRVPNNTCFQNQGFKSPPLIEINLYQASPMEDFANKIWIYSNKITTLF